MTPEKRARGLLPLTVMFAAVGVKEIVCTPHFSSNTYLTETTRKHFHRPENTQK
jgi:hypothetical protein